MSNISELQENSTDQISNPNTKDIFRKDPKFQKKKNIFFFLLQVCVLVGNKVDMPGRKITRDEVLPYAQEIHAVYFETSAQENIGKYGFFFFFWGDNF